MASTMHPNISVDHKNHSQNRAPFASYKSSALCSWRFALHTGFALLHHHTLTP